MERRSGKRSLASPSPSSGPAGKAETFYPSYLCAHKLPHRFQTGTKNLQNKRQAWRWREARAGSPRWQYHLRNVCFEIGPLHLCTPSPTSNCEPTSWAPARLGCGKPGAKARTPSYRVARGSQLSQAQNCLRSGCWGCGTANVILNQAAVNRGMGADDWPNGRSLSGGDIILNCTLVYSAA
jgi:hypothetical protein